MLQIRPDQMQVFLDYVRESFVARVVQYLRSAQAAAVAAMADEDLRAFVRRQIDAAEGYGITSEAPVVKFIEIALAFGEDFHRSGQWPEAERILTEQTDPLTRIEALCEAARRNFAPPETRVRGIPFPP